MGQQEKAMLLMLKGAIGELKPEDQEKIKECHDRLIAICKEYDESNGNIALSLASLEIAAADE